ncbi:HYD1 signature containing ADP-ribosyltransferase family protein [Clostridium sp. DJ247]|uniref:HYD1 signature containing ADP-ribosyltransferase family protein n=1 Tax=Clostridium sp. DJ247 TaxID=2726188 RepID=UPI001A9AEDB2|nr:HYD1 signature containing ADP-ribosyltransferase family protein [Clostridium sp. DJ247]
MVTGGKRLVTTKKYDIYSFSPKGAAEAAEETTRVRHYTNRKGINGIEQDGSIIAKDNNRVYVEPANKKPLSQIEAETKYQLKPGKGRDYVEFDVPNSQLEWVKNPRYGTPELTIKGGVEELLNSKFFRRK